jgi:hypothetical protein
METLIACALAHVVAPGRELPDGSVVRSTARSAVAPPGSGSRSGGPGAAVAEAASGYARWRLCRPGFRHDDRGYAASPNDAEAGIAPLSLIGRSSCCTLLLQKSIAQMQHQVKCSNSCWWTYAESTSGRRS